MKIERRQKMFHQMLTTMSALALLVLFAPFGIPLFLAAIFAFAMEPYVLLWVKKKNLSRAWIVGIMMFLLIVILLTPVVLSGYRLFYYAQVISETGWKNSSFYAELIALKTHIIDSLNSGFGRFSIDSKWNISETFNRIISQTGQRIMAVASGLVSQLPDILMDLFVFCLSTTFFLLKADKFKLFFYQRELLPQKESRELIHILQRCAYSTLFTNLVVGLIQAFVVAIGSLIFGVGDFTIVFFATFIFSFIPVIGAAPVALLLAAISFVLGQSGAGIGLLVVSVIAGSIDNIVRPYLIGADQDINPIVALLAVIGAVIVFGLPGLFLGPFILGVAVKIVGEFSLQAFQNPPILVKVEDAAKPENAKLGIYQGPPTAL